jgi:hypothetical protein
MNFKKVKGFECIHCHQWVSFDKFIGTHFRNHCPFCLWSKHVDEKKSGDRQAFCHGLMKPIGLTFKKEGFDKYGQPRQGELMIIHQCQDCGQISINRLAADDEPQMILKIFEESKRLEEETLKKIKTENIRVLTDKDKKEIETQLFGKS